MALAVLSATRPHVFSHNLETVRRLTPLIRSNADYDRSLAVLRFGAKKGLIIKSSIMLGMGESHDEIITALADLREAGVTRVAMGQYLQPSKAHLDVVEYLSLQRFDDLRDVAIKMGFTHVESGSLVRSSYHAERGDEQ